MSSPQVHHVAASAHRLSQLVGQFYPNNFTFHVGDTNYECNRVFADFVAPKSFELHCSDPTADSSTLQFRDRSRVFGLFCRLMRGEEIEFISVLVDDFCSISYELGNIELLTHFFQTNKRELNALNVVDLLKQKLALGLDATSEIEYILRCFSEIEFLSLEELDLDLLHMILMHNDLKLDSDDYLLKFCELPDQRSEGLPIQKSCSIQYAQNI
jgi:hypothetical protein